MWRVWVTFICFAVTECVPVENSGRRLRKPDPEETPGLIEGDIIPPPLQGSFRSAIKEKEKLWPNGEVAYEFMEGKHALNETERKIVFEAMEEFNKHTCIRFIPHTNEEYFVIFRKGPGCSSNVGMVNNPYASWGNGQMLVLGESCYQLGRIMHEMMHALGFYHEHNRWDRDDYVIIRADKIEQGKLLQFRMFNPNRVNYDLGAPYDYGSLMHYSRSAFTVYEGDESIIPIKPGVTIGQREGFSPIDIWKINKLYNCPDYRTATISPDAYTTPQKPVSVHPTPPTRTMDTLMCNFDYGTTCGIRDTLESDFEWKMKVGKSSLMDTGPDTDLSGDGAYMYLSTIIQISGKKAYLVTPFLDASPGSCLKFAYHMYGETIGTLRVFVRDYTGKEQELFTESGDHGNRWMKFATTFSSDKPFEIYFEGIVGGDRVDFPMATGNIAIDDIRIRPLTKYAILGCEVR